MRFFFQKHSFNKRVWLAGSLALTILAACSGDRAGNPGQGSNGGTNCTGNCADTPTQLSSADVQTILAQAIQEAQANNAPATIAVTDRVGNVLAVYEMTGAATTFAVPALHGTTRTGLEGIAALPSSLAAISKAVTGAYLSSEGNAFSTRTASQIVQEHFNVGEQNQASGPLFGVQFSQLACSDLNRRIGDNAGANRPGPKRSPLGLAADAGGFPLYKNGTVVGGIGVIADGVYGLDPNIQDQDNDLDEKIAWAATFGFVAPQERRANFITVDGKNFRYTDTEFGQTRTGGQAPNLGVLASAGALKNVTGYYASGDGILAGTAFGQTESGYVPIPAGTGFDGLDGFQLVDNAGTVRFPAISGSDGLLTQNEVRTVLRSALQVANRTRAQIRRPLSTPARVTISVVDSTGAILGIVRTRDAPIFGTDVSLQKARSAAFFSNPNAGVDLDATGSTEYLNPNLSPSGVMVNFSDYHAAMNADFGSDPLTGTTAFSDRSIGNLARPFYPDGIESNAQGPLSKPFAQWSPFSTGLQLDLVFERIVEHAAFVLGALPTDTASGCSGAVNPALGPALGANFKTTIPMGLNNGLQIFPGSVPIYKGNVLAGAIGISGDGIDQDDMIASLGLKNASNLLGTINHAPAAMRSDQRVVRGVRLRYVQCPQAPFIDSNEQNVCGSL